MADKKIKLMDEDGYRQLISIIIALKSKNDDVLDKCITVYTEGTTYEAGDCVLYRPTGKPYYGSYICKGVHVAPKELNEMYWECIDSTDFEYYTEQEILDMIGLSQQEIQNLQSLLNDGIISTSYTHSSSKIYSDIQDAIDVAKAYTQAQLGKAVKPAYLEVSSTSEMTDAHYIYLLSNGTNFDMYILENGTTPKKIGTSDIDLSGYVQTSTLEADYLKKTDATSTYATIATVEDKADKSSIVTPSSTSTTDQIANAKDTYDMIDGKQSKLKHSIWSLDEVNRVDRTELSYGAIEIATAQAIGIADAVDYFHVIYLPWDYPYPTEILVTCAGQKRMYLRTCANGTWDTPIEIQTMKDYLKLANLSNDGYARISSWVDSNNGRTQMSFDINTTGGKVERIQFDDIDGQLSVYENDGSNNWTWKGNYVKTKVLDVPLTQLNLTSNFSGAVFYQVKGGYCTVYICNLTCTITGNGQVVSNDLLPNLVAPVVTSPVEHDASDIKVGLGYVDRDIRLLKMHVYKNAVNGYATFSYPVAE